MFFNILENSQILYPWPFRAYPHCGRCQWLSARKLSSQKSSPQCLYYISEKLNFVFSWTKCQYKSLHFTQKNCIPKIIYTLFSNLWEKIFIGVTVIKAFIAHLFFFFSTGILISFIFCKKLQIVEAGWSSCHHPSTRFKNALWLGRSKTLISLQVRRNMLVKLKLYFKTNSAWGINSFELNCT